MEDDATNVIEEYLLLVREKLPESIADDVITELRTYMMEAASEAGGGTVTVESAKKAVARFGAPGEVADEYRYSMFPESLDQLPLPSHPDGQARGRIDALKTVEEEAAGTAEKPPRGERQPTDPTFTYSSAFARVGGLLGLTALLVGVLSTVQGPIWSSLLACAVLLVQIVVVLLCFVVRLVRLKQEGKKLWDKTDESWSGLQRALSLPEGISDETSNRVAYLSLIHISEPTRPY